MTGPWHEQWVAALDALDLDLDAAEALLSTDHLIRHGPVADLWRPPVGLGPLPLDLRPRVDLILARQLATAALIGQALANNRRQVTFLGRLESQLRPERRPAYVDCAM